MWNNRHPSDENGDNNPRPTDPNNDPRLAAVAALASFSHNAFGAGNPLQTSYPGSAPPQAQGAPYQEGSLSALDPSAAAAAAGHPSFAQQAIYGFPHTIHPQQPQYGYNSDLASYAHQMAAYREAEQLQRQLQGQQQQQQQQQQQSQYWASAATAADKPTSMAQRQTSFTGQPPSDPGEGALKDPPNVNQSEHTHGNDCSVEREVVEQKEEAKDPEQTEDPDPVQEEVVPLKPRGKPEAMAAKLAAAQIEAKRLELEEERKEVEEATAEAVAEPIADEDSGGVLATVATPPTKKTTPKKRSPAKKSRKKATPTSKNAERTELLLSETPPPISKAEYESLESLMIQFCRVPLLAEFSRPVSLLHPELVAVYSKIVTHPVDLGHVCRGIRRRQYTNTRDVRLDMWRVFANCVKFHSHPHNKEAVPSFVSIALHLREYFNTLWQEYMLPSDLPEDASDVIRFAFSKRDKDRRKRMASSGVLAMSDTYANKTAALLRRFIDSGGCVDALDKEPIFGEGATIEGDDLEMVVNNLKRLERRLAEEISRSPEEYGLDKFSRDLKQCYTVDVLEENPALQNRIGNRLDRFFWKRCLPLHESNTRGVTQSSIWGNIAATIWARESSKKPYWPALCLGILPPTDQREPWHAAVTDRNEARLPEKLRTQLMTAKRRCEQAQKRQNLSYFLVEFLGTHEFIWVRETDIVEKFDPEDDPNKNVKPGPKKKRASRSNTTAVVGSKAYATALEECTWATEEYEAVLQDAFNEESDQEEVDEEEEMNYSYAVLAQSDDEADDEDDHGFQYDQEAMHESDADEANWLLSHEGMIDVGHASRKKGKKKTQSAKKKTGKKDASDSASKSKTEQQKRRTRAREEKKELRDLEKRRRKRSRDREKALKDEARRQKRRRTASTYDSDEDDRGLARDKRARANAIVKAYLTRMAKSDDYNSLALNGVLTIPAAMVDSTSLLGMALAFRAAAGEVSMPDESEEQITKTTKPWAAIDTTGPKTSEERTKNLEKQIELLEKETQRVRRNTKKRKELTEDAMNELRIVEQEIEADDAAARLNHFKKKKKTSPKPSKDKSSVRDESPSLGTLEHKSKAGEGVEGATGEPQAAEEATLNDAEATEEHKNDSADIKAKPESAAGATDFPTEDAVVEQTEGNKKSVQGICHTS